MDAPSESAPDEQRLHGWCALCRSRCGCISVVRDRRLEQVLPDPEHPTGKALCAKGRAAPELVYSPDRLLKPLKRTAPKGAADPGWREITWDEALDETAAAMRRIADAHGPEAVAFAVTTPSGTAMSDAIQWVERLIRAFGSPNTVYSTEICNWHKDVATAFTYGRGVGAPDYARTGCIVHWGHNPNTSWLTHAQGASAAKARGAKLVVVDPRRVGGAVKADAWLRVRPGADGALALGIAGLMVANGWIDEEFLKCWSTGPFLIDRETGRFLRGSDLQAAGDADAYAIWSEAAGCVETVNGNDTGGAALRGSFDVETLSGTRSCCTAFELYAELCAQWTPERVADEAWVSAEQVVDTARLLWENRPVSYYAWSGVGQHTNATQTDRAISLLYALTGSYDAPGGNLVHEGVPLRDLSGRDLVAPEQRERGLEMAERPLGPGRGGWVTSDAFYRAVLEERPYPVKGLVAFGTNMLVSHAGTERGRRALEALEFCVHADLFMTPSAAYADIVLPVASAWEREAVRAGFDADEAAQELVQWRAPAVTPRGEARSDMQIVFDLATRLGLGNRFWNGDMDAAWQAMLAPSGVSLDELRAAPRGLRLPLEPRYRKFSESAGGGFATPSGRIEIYCETFLDHGQTPLPEYVAPAAVRDRSNAEKFPLMITSGKSTLFCHSQGRNLPSLRVKQKDPPLELHPDAAFARGIEEGEWVEVETPRGRMRAVARFNASLDERVVVAQQGWWQGCSELGLEGFGTDADGGANYNAVVGNEAVDPISGSVPHRSYVCEVRAVSDDQTA